MPDAARETGDQRPVRRLTRRQADDRVARLRRTRVPSTTGAEDLDLPLDPCLRVETEFPSHHLVLRVDGEDVSRVWVTQFEQYIGTETVRMGGIGGVDTHRDHRLRGYCRRVMESALRWMRRNGFDTTMLYGITSFYPKFGFAKAFPSVSTAVAVRDAETTDGPSLRVVKLRREHLPAVLAMYHRVNAGRTGPIRRDPAHWRRFRKGLHFGSKAVPKVLLGDDGAPAGYVVFDSDPTKVSIIEAAAWLPAAIPAIMAHAARVAVRRRVESIRLFLPEDHELVEFCRMLGARVESTYGRDGGAMVRMISVPSALEKIAGDLARRVDGTGQFTIRTNLDSVGLAWSGGVLAVGAPHRGGPQARMPQWALAQLLYGYASAASLVAHGHLVASRRSVELLGQLFPVQPHFHYAVDHF